MAKLAASILSADFYRLGDEIESALKSGADWIHIDTIDGKFAPPVTFGSKIIEDIKKHNNAFCDAHLMVREPEALIDRFIEAGTDLVNFHAEAATHGDRMVSVIKESGRLAGVTINPSTPVSAIECYLETVDLILVMSVNPGYSGQKCINYNFKKIEELNTLREKNNYKYLIQIDGGISIKNVEEPLKCGADVIVAGAGFFSASPEEREKLSKIIHNY